MSIEFTCSACRKRFQVPADWVGRLVSCVKCGGKLVVPGASGVVVEPEKVEKVRREPRKETTTTIDWGVIAEQLDESAASVPRSDEGAAPVGKASSSRAVQDDWTFQAKPVIAADPRFKSGRLDHFLLDAMASLPAALGYLPPILMIILLGFGVGIIVGVLALVMGFVLKQMSPGPYPTPPHPAVMITMLIIVLTPVLCYYGLIMQFWLQVSDGTARQDNNKHELPDMTPGGMLHSLLLMLAFVAAFVFPVFTLPLAPLAFLAMGRTQTTAGFRIRWLFEALRQTPVFILIVLCFVPFLMFLMGLAVAWAFPPIHGFIVSYTKDLSPLGQGFVARIVLALTIVPLLMLFGAAICRLVGLVGRYNPAIYINLPRKGNILETLALVIGGLLLGWFVSMPMLAKMAGNGPMFVVFFGSTDRSGPANPVAPDPAGPPVRPVVPPGPVQVRQPAEPMPDLAQLPAAVRVIRAVEMLDAPRLEWRVHACDFLSTTPPVEAHRVRVDQALRSARYWGASSTDYLRVAANWVDDRAVLSAMRLQHPNLDVVSAALVELNELEVRPAHRDYVAQQIGRRMAGTTFAGDQRLLLAKALVRWSPDPMPLLLMVLRNATAADDALVKLIGSLMTVRDVDPLLTSLDMISSEADRMLPVYPHLSDEVKRAVIGKVLPRIRSTYGTRTTNARRVLEAVAAKGHAELFWKEMEAGDRVTSAIAREMLLKIDPDNATSLKMAIARLASDRTTIYFEGGQREEDPLTILVKAEPTDEDRPAVIAALTGILEGNRVHGKAQFFEAFARWADEAVILDLVKRLQGQQVGALSRRDLFRILGKTAHPKAINAVAEELGGLDHFAASAALIEMGRAAEDHVLRQLRSINEDVKRRSIDVLAKIGGQKSLDVLIPIAKGKQLDFSTRYNAGRAVLEIQERLKEKK